jgi:hypothetical protein
MWRQKKSEPDLGRWAREGKWAWETGVAWKVGAKREGKWVLKIGWDMNIQLGLSQFLNFYSRIKCPKPQFLYRYILARWHA